MFAEKKTFKQILSPICGCCGRHLYKSCSCEIGESVCNNSSQEQMRRLNEFRRILSNSQKDLEPKIRELINEYFLRN